MPKFSKGNGPELWVIIFEKAWAKIHGSYDRIESGTVYLTLRDLTGAPGFSVPNIK
jgi:calpain-15